jgi:hypothetical protein
MIQTWEHKGITWTNKDKYLVRTTHAPGVCDACAGALERQRLAADLLCLVPLVGVFLALVATSSKPLFGVLLVYLVYLARYLDYNWADSIVYGSAMLEKVRAWVPDGDPGQAYLPVSWLHMGVRVAAIPAGLIAFLSVGSAVLPLVGGRTAPAATSPSAARSYPAERLAHVSMALAEDDFAVPVKNGKPGFYTQQMGGKPIEVLRVKVGAPGTGEQAMTGRQLADAFLSVRSESMLVIDGAGENVAAYRFEVERMRGALRR